ncbi:ABC transporter substrate-binding protein (plasmid) [Skermanella mucosa]|uniref:ABC transporter substrate-binding protein n=1 Tax=Skermanella mucosa TaxID=1789672 RepID=UPI001E332FF0|nr:ABC transporter substrate-binding protein [Skermanella mucosa]UEM25333.1 ABC transporter substrate-binding protein [Skermanella mucosa]
MRVSMLMTGFGAGLAVAVAAGLAAPAATAQTAEVLHWWTSGGESAALGEVRSAFTARGGTWNDTPIAGGANARAAAVNRMIGNDAPAIFQFSVGEQLKELAAQGFVGDVQQVAAAGNWDAVLPPLIARIAKEDGKYIAAPLNIHGENWMFYNTAVLEKAGVAVPKTWPEFLEAAGRLKAAGVTPIALGGQPWQERVLFNTVLLGVGGREHYARVYGDLDKAAMNSDAMLEAFSTFAALRGFVDEGSPGRRWNEATAMLMRGDAAFQFTGDWAKGELVAAGIEPGTTVGCMLAPAKDAAYIMAVDAFSFGATSDPQVKAAQKLMAEVIMDPQVQIAFNRRKGSIPVRTDVTDPGFDSCAKLAIATIKDPATHLVSTGLFGVSSAVSGAIDDAISQFWNSPSMTPEQGRSLFVQTVEDAR